MYLNHTGKTRFELLIVICIQYTTDTRLMINLQINLSIRTSRQYTIYNYIKIKQGMMGHCPFANIINLSIGLFFKYKLRKTAMSKGRSYTI